MDTGMKQSLSEQRKALAAIESELKILEARDVYSENESLRKKVETLEAVMETLTSTETALKAENAALRNSLYEQFYSEKLSLIKRSEEKLDIFFGRTAGTSINSLNALEYTLLERLKQGKAVLDANKAGVETELHRKISELSFEVRDALAKQRENVKMFAMSGSDAAEYQNLRTEKLTDEQIVALAKKNNFEKFIGLNVMNIIGIVLIVIGVIAAAQFVQALMTDELRTFAIFVLGLAFLFAGEFVNRRKPGIFSLGITAGGVAILYVAVAAGFFMFGVIGAVPAIVMTVAITGTAFTLSTRYDSETILTLTILGGYLPIFSFGPNRQLFIGLLLYFVSLNLLAFFVSFRKKWSIASFVGLGLTIISMQYFAFTALRVQAGVLGIFYIMFAWTAYIAIPLVGTYKSKQKFGKRDITLMSIATFFGAFILLINMDQMGLYQILSFAVLAISAAYFYLSFMVHKKFDEEKPMSAFFFITGVTFAVLFIPLQFDASWLAPAWLVQALGVGLYGILWENKNFKRTGLVIAALCLGWFIIWDVSRVLEHGATLGFTVKYASITLASFMIMLAYAFKKELYGVFQKNFKYFTLINFWLFVLYGITRIELILAASFPYSQMNINYLALSSMGMVSVFLSLVLPKFKLLYDPGVKNIATFFGVAGILGIFMLNIALSPVDGLVGEQERAIVFLAVKVLVLDSFVSAYAVFNITRRAVVERIIGSKYLPLICSLYITVIASINMVNQFGLGFASFWITILYAAAALLWTILGFYKRYSLLRIFGLVMCFVSVGKFFVVDLFFLSQGLRILSYFALGIVLVAISYVYQYFSKRLELHIVKSE